MRDPVSGFVPLIAFLSIPMTHVSHRLVAILLLGLWILGSGCRTYGDYGNEAKTLEQIQQANALFADALERARGNLALLEDAADANPAYATAAVHYAEIVRGHEIALTYHRELEEVAEDNEDDYRTLHRSYGAIVAEQRLTQDQYARVVDGLRRTLQATDAEADPRLVQRWSRLVPLTGRYHVAPPYYEQVGYARPPRVELRDLLGASPGAGVLSMPEPGVDEQGDTDLSE